MSSATLRKIADRLTRPMSSGSTPAGLDALRDEEGYLDHQHLVDWCACPSPGSSLAGRCPRCGLDARPGQPAEMEPVDLLLHQVLRRVDLRAEPEHVAVLLDALGHLVVELPVRQRADAVDGHYAILLREKLKVWRGEDLANSVSLLVLAVAFREQKLEGAQALEALSDTLRKRWPEPEQANAEDDHAGRRPCDVDHPDRLPMQDDDWKEELSQISQIMQPVEVAHDGMVRFVANPLVRHLLDHGGIDMNQLAAVAATDAERAQFAQLIGYSIRGFGELSYVSDAAWDAAESAGDACSKAEERGTGTDAKPEVDWIDACDAGPGDYVVKDCGFVARLRDGEWWPVPSRHRGSTTAPWVYPEDRVAPIPPDADTEATDAVVALHNAEDGPSETLRVGLARHVFPVGPGLEVRVALDGTSYAAWHDQQAVNHHAVRGFRIAEREAELYAAELRLAWSCGGANSSVQEREADPAVQESG